MSTLGDVWSGIRKMLLIEEAIGRMEKDIDTLGDDLRRTREYAETIDGRVSRIEGFLDGVAAASGQPPRLPKD